MNDHQQGVSLKNHANSVPICYKTHYEISGNLSLYSEKKICYLFVS